MEDGCMWHCVHALAQAKADLGTNLSTGIGGLRYEPWHGHRRTKVRALARTHADLGEVVSLRGGMDMVARKTLEHALGTMPRQDPRTHGSAIPSRWDSTEPRLTPSVPGHDQAPPSSSCPIEKHGPRPLRNVRKCPEHVAIDQAVEAVMGPGDSKRARQLGNCLDHKGSGVLLSKRINVIRTVPTLPHLNLFLVVLGGHRSLSQRTLDLLEKQRPDAIRTVPVFLDGHGRVFWRLRGSFREASILVQDIGTRGSATPKEKWFIYDGEQNKVVEKYISLSKNMLRMRKVSDKFAFATCEARLKDDTLDDPSPSSGV
ncbi:hypothetical protein Syun_021621 [Stephania yunnanensis]|uniref:Uncharacterized protein n=1 Tax=Stephania yunnanensis TaxID=152371 RepID=A0AAP0IFX7_9MAGN